MLPSKASTRSIPVVSRAMSTFRQNPRAEGRAAAAGENGQLLLVSLGQDLLGFLLLGRLLDALDIYSQRFQFPTPGEVSSRPASVAIIALFKAN